MTLQHILPPFTTPDFPLFLAACVPAALALALTAWTVRRREPRTPPRPGGPAVKVATLAALACTAYSADTSWRFAADYLDMAGTAERAGMFAAGELALFATALMARQNLATEGAPGLPGTLVWVITGVQVIPAYAESGAVGGTVRAVVGPVMAAMLWHLAMGIELRLHTPGAASRGLIAVLGREARERLLSRLGIAARDRDAAQITRDRATARAVTLAARLAERTPAQQRNLSGRRLTRRLSKALGRASVGTDPIQRAQLLDQLAARRHALGLATVQLPSPWSPAHSGARETPVVPKPQADEPLPTPVIHGPGEPDSDQEPNSPQGTVTDIAAPKAEPNTGTDNDDAGTTAPEDRAAPGTGLEASRQDTAVEGTRTVSGTETAGDPGPTTPVSGTDTTADPGPTTPVSGTDTTADPGPTTPVSGTDTTADPGPTTPVSGTDTTADPGPTTPVSGTDTTADPGRKPLQRRKTAATSRTKNRGKRARSRSRQTQHPVRELDESELQLVRTVRPHVPVLLARDNNTAITRVQLREIIRREGLPGVGNDRITYVLRELRSEDSTTTRSTR
nr:hypothetical protein [Streptomyces acidiscabies]